jgi:hypothetical protein
MKAERGLSTFKKDVGQTGTLAEAHPDIAAQWHPSRNGTLDPTVLPRGSGRRVWWLCLKGHEWEATINYRTHPGKHPRGCPYCSGRRVLRERSLAAKRPDLCVDLHPTRNGDCNAWELAPNTHRRLWWRCVLGHEWEASVDGRAAGSGCPWCSGRRVLPAKSLAVRQPGLATELHPTRNGNLDPLLLAANSAACVWWRCTYGHSWRAVVSSRTAGRGCPWCSGRRYLLREDVFATPLSATALYHLGLLAADGCVSGRNETVVSLGLQPSDRAAVVRFARFCGLSSMKMTVGLRVATVAFTSERMACDLARHGVVPRKSRGLEVSDEAATSASFWLGYFDGDGWATLRSSRVNWISGSRRLIEQCAEFWETHLGRLPAVHHSPARGTYGVILQGSSAQHAAEVLLAAQPVSLERKRAALVAISQYDSVHVRVRKRQRTRSCGWCGADVVRTPSLEAHLANVFCSREHYLAWRWGQR